MAYKRFLRKPVEGCYIYAVSHDYAPDLTETVALLRFKIDTGRKADVVERVGLDWRCTAYIYPLDFKIGEPIDPTVRHAPDDTRSRKREGQTGSTDEEVPIFETAEEWAD